MKKINVAIAILALASSASASAMPAQIPDSWYGLMMHRLGIMADNPGFCGAVQAWFC